MFNIGIIGAGAISESHVNAYLNNPQCRVVAIADLNLSLAEEMAKKHEIPRFYSDYRELLADTDIDAVSIATPTFTHTPIVLDSLRAGKHVLCEKPPALSADEVRECFAAAKEEKRLLMYGLVCRFRAEISYLKEYIDSGKMGRVITAEAERTTRLSRAYGWFNSHALGGGVIRDEAIHELDQLLYLMSYPEPEVVFAFTDSSCGGLIDEIDGVSGYKSKDETKHERDVEDVVKMLITFKNGSSLTLKASSILMTLNPKYYLELSASRGGARLEPFGEKKLSLLEIDGASLSEREVMLERTSMFAAEINHFVDALSGADCICKPNEIIRLMEIIDAIYKSAETKKPIFM